MNRIEISFSTTIVVDPEDMHYKWREELGADQFEAIYPYQITHYLKNKYHRNFKQLITDLYELDGRMDIDDSTMFYVWEKYDNE